ncbi:MAG: sodium:solute symporter [Pseudomonadota bacterium]
MPSGTGFGVADWLVLAAYLLGSVGLGWWLSQRGAQTSKDYFLASGSMPVWLIAFSVLATTQSAATFLGGPDTGFRGDYTYLAGTLSMVLASLGVSRFLLPRFYALQVTTVYELLNQRYGPVAMRAAGGMYLLGRVLANGSRLFMAALAVAMILFLRVDGGTILIATILITILGLILTIGGGLRSVITSDAIQFGVYVGAAVIVLILILSRLGLSSGELISALALPPVGDNKLTFLDFSFRLDDPFTVPAVITGVALLNLGNFGLDQDTTQRLLAAKDAQHAGKAIMWASLGALPIVFIFLSIGQLLHIFYERTDLTGLEPAAEAVEATTVFMRYILSELPTGLRGLCGAAVLAAAVSTLTSGLNSMASVAVKDFYEPLVKRGAAFDAVRAGRIAMTVIAVVLLLTALLCYYWQQSTDLPLLEFALQVMVFAYAGLIGVFAAAIFTARGSETSIVAALAAGFLFVLIGDPAFGGSLGVPAAFTSMAFPWKLTLGSLVSFGVAVLPAGSNAKEDLTAEQDLQESHLHG